MGDHAVLISRTVTNREGKTFLEVDGKPFLFNSIQSWYPPEADYRLYMEKAWEANYRVFSFWLFWRHLEPAEGVYDWSELDKVIELANQYDLRLDIVWAGSDFCGHIDRRFAPDWLLDRHAWHLKDKNGDCVNLDAFDLHLSHGIDCKKREALEKEKKIITDMMHHLRIYDTKHRIISFQVENEVNINDWTGQAKKDVLRYCNEIGGAVKASDYVVATRMNLGSGHNDPDINALSNIDFYGPDPYSSEVEDIRSVINDTEHSRMPCISENAAYENSTEMMAVAFAEGGFYSIYRVDYDSVWNKPGVFDKGWKYWSVTFKIRDFNKALNKINQLIASSPKSKMTEFILGDDDVSNGGYRYRILSGRRFGVSSKKDSACIIVERRGEYYVVADGPMNLVMDGRPFSCGTGRMDGDGNWDAEADRSVTKNPDSGYMVPYYVGECIKIQFSKKGEK